MAAGVSSMDPRWVLMRDETRSAGWQPAVSRIGNPLTIQHFKSAAALPIANLRHVVDSPLRQRPGTKCQGAAGCPHKNSPAGETRRLLDLEGDIQLLNGLVHAIRHAITVGFLQLVTGVFEQAPGFGKLFVGFPLPLFFRRVAADLQAQLQGGGGDLLHRFGAMAGIIRVRMGQEAVGVDQFFARRFGVRDGAERQGQYNG